MLRSARGGMIAVHCLHVTVRFGVEVTSLVGDDGLEGVEITEKEGRMEAIETTRMFVAIGGVPNTEWASETDIVRVRGGYLMTGPDLITANALPSCWPLERAPRAIGRSAAARANLGGADRASEVSSLSAGAALNHYNAAGSAAD